MVEVEVFSLKFVHTIRKWALLIFKDEMFNEQQPGEKYHNETS